MVVVGVIAVIAVMIKITIIFSVTTNVMTERFINVVIIMIHTIRVVAQRLIVSCLITNKVIIAIAKNIHFPPWFATNLVLFSRSIISQLIIIFIIIDYYCV